MFCKKCGTQIPDDSEFCESCGTRLGGPKLENILRDDNDADGDGYIAVKPEEGGRPKEQPTAEPIKEAEQPKPVTEDQPKFQSFIEDEAEKSPNKKLIWTAVILGLVVVAVVVAIFFSMRSKKKAEDSIFSEQTHDPAAQVTTAKQTETQAKDEKNGYFEREYSDGSKYKGNFSEGLWDGKGVYTSTTGVIFDGTFKKGAITGEGSIYYANKDEYQGEYKNGQRDGQGVLFYKDGTKYKGSFVADKRSGSGEVWYITGDYFSGKFVNDLKQGRGEYAFASGDVYKGEYQGDRPEGQGTMTYKNGDTFTGTFKAGEKNGLGEYKFANGDIVKGNWTSNDMTGNFTFYNNATGKMEEDVAFEDGKRK